MYFLLYLNLIRLFLVNGVIVEQLFADLSTLDLIV